MASLIRRPSAFIPLAMSLTALALVLSAVLSDIAAYGRVIHPTDEGAVAHLFQILMAGQLPLVGFFAMKWLPSAPRQALGVLAMQTGAGLAAIAPVFFFHL